MNLQKEQEEKDAILDICFNEVDYPVFVLAVNAETLFIYHSVNKAHEKITGIKPDDIIGKTPEELSGIPPENIKAIRGNYEKCIKTGKLIQYREAILIREKETHWFTTLSPVKNAEGKVYRIIGTSLPVDDLVQTQKELENKKAKLEEQVKKRQKEAELVLEQSEEKYRAIFESATDAFIIAGMEGKIVEANPAACKTYGYSHTEMTGKNVAELMHPDYRHKIPELVKLIQKKGSFKGEGLDVKKDGTTFYTEVKGSAINFNNKIHSLIIIRDVSEKKKFNIKLAEEKRFTDAIINALPGVFYIIGKNGKYVKWNSALEKLTGYSAETLSNISPLDSIAPYHRAKIAGAMKNVFQRGQDSMEADHLTTKGIVPYLFTGVKIEQNGEQWLLGLGIDISKRVKAEKEKEQALKKLNERIKEISCLFDINEVVKNQEINVPEMMSSIIEVIPKGWHYPEKTAVKILFDNNIYQSTNFQDSAYFIEEKIVIHEKTRGKIKVVGAGLDEEQEKLPFLKEEKRLLKTIGNNISAYISRIENEKAKQKLREELERSNKELEQFAYVASHDLQEPLRMVSSYTQMLQRRYKGKLDEKADKYIYYAVDGARRMQNLINDLLEFSRVTTKGEKLTLTDMNKAAQSAIEHWNLKIQETNAAVTVDNLPSVKADAAQIERLFSNLIGNSIKFRKPGEAPKIHIAVKDNGKNWLFSLSDNGIGIEEKFSEKVFVIFQRLHSTSSYKGTGIGLAVCKQIINRHGGEIWFKSKENKGTTFYFTLKKLNAK
ncbi:MAG: PAS domain S-box protein [Prolixibacteraceae bacterium]